jgi:hypothetical protein
MATSFVGLFSMPLWQRARSHHHGFRSLAQCKVGEKENKERSPWNLQNLRRLHPIVKRDQILFVLDAYRVRIAENVIPKF